MTGPSALTATARRGALRLVVLAITLAGFAALHAFGSVAGDGAHCGSAPALMMVTDPHGTAAPLSPDHHATAVAAQEKAAWADATAPSRNSDNMTTGCLLALIGALVLIGLRLLRRFIDTTPRQLRRAVAWPHAARAPPRPLFLSLCVLRL